MRKSEVSWALRQSRPERISGRIAEAALGKRKLGEVALELIVLENALEYIIDGDYAKSSKEQARMSLEEIREARKKLATLYLTTKVAKRRAARGAGAPRPAFEHHYSIGLSRRKKWRA